eukprot:3533-Heterococcus_DN1.PRE.1
MIRVLRAWSDRHGQATSNKLSRAVALWRRAAGQCAKDSAAARADSLICVYCAASDRKRVHRLLQAVLTEWKRCAVAAAVRRAVLQGAARRVTSVLQQWKTARLRCAWSALQEHAAECAELERSRYTVLKHVCAALQLRAARSAVNTWRTYAVAAATAAATAELRSAWSSETAFAETAHAELVSVHYKIVKSTSCIVTRCFRLDRADANRLTCCRKVVNVLQLQQQQEQAALALATLQSSAAAAASASQEQLQTTSQRLRSRHTELALNTSDRSRTRRTLMSVLQQWSQACRHQCRVKAAWTALVARAVHFEARATEECSSRAAAAAQALAVQQRTALKRITNRLASHTLAAAAADQHSALHAWRAVTAHVVKRQAVLLAVVQRLRTRQLVTFLLQWRAESALRGQQLRMMKRLLSRNHKLAEDASIMKLLSARSQMCAVCYNTRHSSVIASMSCACT